MTMQRTPLLLSRILGRGAALDPNEEVVTLLADGTHRQTLKATGTERTNWRMRSREWALSQVTVLPASCGTTTGILSFTKQYPQWELYYTR